MKMPTVMKGSHSFAQVPSVRIERSTFDRSHGLKTTFDSGLLIPIYVDEALPGDTFSLSMAGFARLATPLHPIMDNLYMETFFFAVPYRLVWDNWQRFNGEQTNPGDSTSFVVPQFTAHIPSALSLSDYMGIPVAPQIGTAFQYTSLWHRAYNLIFNTWFRDENLIASLTVDKGDGPDAIANYVLKRRGKRHDYFTSALPWPQKGTAVTIPLGTTAPIIPAATPASPTFRNLSGPGNAGYLMTDRITTPGTPGLAELNATSGSFAATDRLYWLQPNLLADLSSATGATINSLRQAFQIQKLLERDARGGTRYTEIIKAHFGVTSPDARLQRPEYLGGGSTPIIINPVAQTSAAALQPTPQGNLSGVGTASFAGGHGFSKSFTEHCLLLGLVNVRADLTYQQGLPRMFSRSTRYDFYWPALAHIGEQTVLNKEIYATGGVNDPLVFGYQERYAEYRYKPSRICGEFRSTFSPSLDSWHLSQNFGVLPVLNEAFISEVPPVDRISAVSTDPQFLLDAFFSLKCARPMPVFGVPGFIDHF